MTYNVQIGVHDSLIMREDRKDTLLKIIKKVDPDIICLQECSKWHIRGFEPALTEDYPFIAHSQNMYSKFEIVNSFIVIPDTLSSEYLAMKEESPELYKGCDKTGIFYCADIKIREHVVRIINVRLASNNVSTVSASSVINKFNNCVKNYQYGERMRKIQSQTIIHAIMASPYPVVLCGDMNDVSGSANLRDFKKYGLKDAWWESGFGYGATYNDHDLLIRIDHVFYGNKLKPIQSTVIQSNFSDHLPLIVDFNFK